jgi:hypothetical protein
VYPFPPYVYSVNGTLTGFAVEVYEQVLAELNTSYGYNLFATYSVVGIGAFNRQLRDSADMGIYGFAVTQDQQIMFAQSIPFKNSIIRAIAKIQLRRTTLQVIGDVFSNSSFIQLMLLLFAFAIAISFAVWAVEHKRNEEQFRRDFFEGHGTTLYWIWITMYTVGYGDIAPKTGWGRLLTFIILLVSAVILNLVAGNTAAIFTVRSLQPAPTTLVDLGQNVVATLAGSAAYQLASSIDAQTIEATTTEEAIDLLLNNTVLFFVGEQDNFLALNHTIGDIEFVGNSFLSVQHAFLYPNTSYASTQFYSDFNLALSTVKLRLIYTALVDKYFLYLNNQTAANAVASHNRDWIPVYILIGAIGAYVVVIIVACAINKYMAYRRAEYDRRRANRENRNGKGELDENGGGGDGRQ